MPKDLNIPTDDIDYCLLCQGEVSGGEKHPEVKPTPLPTSKVSTDKNRNYGVLAGTIAILSGIGWYYASKPKKTEQIQED